MPRLLRWIPASSMMVFMLGGVWVFWRATPGQPTDPPAQHAPPGRAGEIVPELVMIEPGALVSDHERSGWSHLVIKTRTELESGDLATLPAFARATATRFRTVILADVERDSTGYGLRKVGVGLTLEHRGGDLVVASSHLDALDVPVSLLDKIVLGRAEAALSRGRLSARTRTFALYDASVELNDEGVHRSIFLRYALLVDPASGELRTFCWPIAASPADRRPPETVIEIPPGTEFRCGIHVLAERAIGGIPVSWYFAMTGLPPGTIHAMPVELRSWSILDPRDADDSAAIEKTLRRAFDGRVE